MAIKKVVVATKNGRQKQLKSLMTGTSINPFRYLYLSIYLSLSLSLCIYLSTFLSWLTGCAKRLWLGIRTRYRYFCPSIILSIYLYCPSIYLTFWLCWKTLAWEYVHVQVDLSTNLSIYISLYLSTFLCRFTGCAGRLWLGIRSRYRNIRRSCSYFYTIWLGKKESLVSNRMYYFYQFCALLLYLNKNNRY